MTNEQKQILLKDLCARLPNFENWVQYEGKDYIVTGYGHGRVLLLSSPFSSVSGPCPLIDEIKPYLRPMSSMTEKEINEYENFITNEKDDLIRFCNELVFYNSHHFDYRGLISMGLALEAPEDMYKED